MDTSILWRTVSVHLLVFAGVISEATQWVANDCKVVCGTLSDIHARAPYICTRIHTEFTTVPMDTIAVMNSYTCLTCDYPGGTSQGWFRDGTIIQGDTTLCDCEVFPEDGRICFNSVTEADADTYSCEAIVGFGQVRACTADLILAGE